MFNYTQQTDNIEFVEIAPVSDLPNGERLFLEIEGKPIVIFNIAGQFFAIGDVCTHDDGPLGDGDLEGFNIVCPRHGAEFDVKRGHASHQGVGPLVTTTVEKRSVVTVTVRAARSIERIASSLRVPSSSKWRTRRASPRGEVS